MIKAAYIIHGELKNTTDDDARKLDIINIAFATCPDGVFRFDHPENLIHLPRLRYAHPGLRILFSIGGWGAGGFSVMSADQSRRRRFIDSCLEAVRRYDLDGIDIDWEYPGIDWADIDASPKDKENFTFLLKELRSALDTLEADRHLMLTIAAGCDSYFIEHTEMDRIAPLLDYVSLMTYDMRGCGDTVTGHHTNLLPASSGLPRAYRSVEHSVNIFHKAGVPLDKIVIGIAFYSRMWTKVTSNSNHGLWQKSEVPGNYGPTYGEISAQYLGKNGFVRYWDEICHAPYLFDGETLISYDDESSIREKIAYVQKHKLAGIMYWEHSCDPSRHLLAVIHDAVKTEKS